MEFAEWSPSHLIFVIIVFVGAVGTGIWRVAVLFNRVKQMEDKVKEQNAKMETISQNLTNHLEGHPNPQQQPQAPTGSDGGMPTLETFQEMIEKEMEKLRGEPSND